MIHSLPWDQQTLTGYTAELCFVALFIGIYLISNGSFSILFVSICLHHQTYYKIFQQSMLEFNHPNENHKELLRKLVLFHISIKKWIQFYLISSRISFFIPLFSGNFRWFLDTANVLSPYVMVHLICNTIFTAGTVFQLDLVYNIILSKNVNNK